MTPLRTTSLLAVTFVGMLLCTSCQAASPLPTFEITEYINEDWMGERVSFPVTLAESLDADKLVIRADDGKVSAAQFVPDAPASRTGRVHFIADLPAKTSRTWTLQAGRPKSDLTLIQGKNFIELGTNRIAVRCPWNVNIPAGGVSASDVPAPVEAVRLTDGTLSCTSTLHSPLKVMGFSSEVLVEGPIFTRVRLTYTYEGGKKHVVELEAITGQDTIRIWEKFDIDDRGYHRRVRPEGAPNGNFLLALYDKELYSEGSYWTITFDKGLNADRVTWQPFHQMWSTKAKEGELSYITGHTLGGRANGDTPEPGEPRYTYAPPTAESDATSGKLWPEGTIYTPHTNAAHLVTLNPTHGEWILNVSKWFGVYSGSNDKNFIALLAWRAGDWRKPHENMIVLEKLPGESPRAVLPINAGARAWGIFASPRDKAIYYPEDWPNTRREAAKPAKGEKYPKVYYSRPAQLAWIKHGYLPLDMVKDWMLDYEGSPDIKYPRLFAQADELPAIRKRIAETPLLRDHVAKLKKTWDDYRATNDPNYPHYPKHHESDLTYLRGLDNVYMATGDEVYAQALAELLIDRLHRYTHNVKSHQGLVPDILKTYFLREADMALGSPTVTDEQKREIRALMLFGAYLFKSPHHAPEGIGYNNHGNTDFIVQKNADVGAIACLFSDHPKAGEWAKRAVEAVDVVLESKEYMPAGSQDEWYGLLNLEISGHAAVELKRGGYRNFFDDPRMRHGLEAYGQLLTVPDPRHGNAGSVVPFGNGQGDWNRTSLWAVAASQTAKTDPEFASRMMWYWHRAGQPGKMRVYGDRFDFGWSALGWIDPTIKPVNPKLTSSYLDGWGALLRSGYGTEHETFMALQLDKRDGLNMAYNAEGGFHLYAKGKPLCLVFGIRSFDVGMHSGFPNIVKQRWMANRPSFDYKSEKGGEAKKLAFATTSAGDLASGQWTFSHLVAYPHPSPKEGPERLILSKPRPEVPGLKYGHTKAKDVEPITWRRHVMFVKDSDPAGPNFFIIRDVADTQVPWDWNIWCLANELTVTDRAGHFDGKFDVDLDVVPITSRGEIVTGSYGPTKSFAGDWHQKVFQLQLPDSGQIAAVLYPRLKGEAIPEITSWADQAGAKILLPDQTHYVVLTDKPVTINADGVKIVGRSAAVRIKGETVSLTLLSGSHVGVKDFAMTAVGVAKSAAGAVTVVLDRKGATITGDSSGGGCDVILQIPGSLAVKTLTIDGEPMELDVSQSGMLMFNLPEGKHTFSLK